MGAISTGLGEVYMWTVDLYAQGAGDHHRRLAWVAA